MAEEGDDIHWCHLDECDCRDHFEVDEEVDDPGGMDPAYHSSDCATQIGYVGSDLPERDVLVSFPFFLIPFAFPFSCKVV